MTPVVIWLIVGLVLGVPLTPLLAVWVALFAAFAVAQLVALSEGGRHVLDTVESDEVYVVPAFISEGYFTQQVIPREFGLEGPVTRMTCAPRITRRNLREPAAGGSGCCPPTRVAGGHARPLPRPPPVTG